MYLTSARWVFIEKSEKISADSLIPVGADEAVYCKQRLQSGRTWTMLLLE